MRNLNGTLIIIAMFIPFTGRTDSIPNDKELVWTTQRESMVRHLRDYYKIKDERVLTVMSRVRRHMFIPEEFRHPQSAYADRALSIGHNQTISQPYIVAYMTERLTIKPGEKVLEIGTGSGYQAAILAECGADVYSIEIIPELAKHAKSALKSEGYEKVKTLTGDGYKGWPEHSPFDAIIVTCAPDKVPEALKAQLAEGGRMIVPVGKLTQRLVILRKKNGQIEQQDDLPVRFVPMVPGKSEN